MKSPGRIANDTKGVMYAAMFMVKFEIRRSFNALGSHDCRSK